MERLRNIPGFDPVEQAIKMVDMNTGSQRLYLPVKGQVEWFWLCFPNGKIDCTPPQVVGGDLAISTCTLYADKGDDPQAFICRQTATYRCVSGKPETQAFIERAQTSAMGRALRFAGFGNEFDYAGDTPPVNYVEQGTSTKALPESFDLSDDAEKPVKDAVATTVTPTVNEPDAQKEIVPPPVTNTSTTPVTAAPIDQIPVGDPPPLFSEETVPDQKPKVGCLPSTMEEALDTVISLPRFGGQTFRAALADGKNNNLPDWICKNSGFSGISDATRVAAQILCQE